MSSASSYEYRVRAEALRREQERRAAEDALRAAELSYAQLRDDAVHAQATWGDSVEVPGELAVRWSSETAAMSAARIEVQRLTHDATKRLAEHVSAVRIGLMRSALANLGCSDDTVAAPKKASEVIALRPSSEERPDVPVELDHEATIERLLGRLEVAVEAGALEGVKTAAGRVRLAGSRSGRDRAIDMLRLEVQKANAAIEKRRAVAKKLDQFERRLDGCRGPEAGATRRLLGKAREEHSAAPIRELELKVEAALIAEEVIAPASFVAETVERVFRESGYEVGPRPSTIAAGGALLVAHSDWPGYGVEVSAGGDPRRLAFELVRGEADRTDQAARDKEVEKQFCSRQDDFLEAFDAAGVEVREIHRLKPGERHIVVRPDIVELERRFKRSEQAARLR